MRIESRKVGGSGRCSSSGGNIMSRRQVPRTCGSRRRLCPRVLGWLHASTSCVQTLHNCRRVLSRGVSVRVFRAAPRTQVVMRMHEIHSSAQSLLLARFVFHSRLSRARAHTCTRRRDRDTHRRRALGSRPGAGDGDEIRQNDKQSNEQMAFLVVVVEKLMIESARVGEAATRWPIVKSPTPRRE